MSMPRSPRKRGSTESRTIAFALASAALLFGAGAQATQADRDQPVNVTANSFAGSQDAGKTTFTGNVNMDQGTLHADGNTAVGYFDQNNQVQRVVLTGGPAHMRQKLDDGTLVHGQANTIDYTVSQNTVVLTGDATVVQEGKGSFHGAKLTYNTDSGQINGEGGTGGQVHMTLQPHPKTAPPAKPATPAQQTAPPTTNSAVPAPASSAGRSQQPAEAMPPPFALPAASAPSAPPTGTGIPSQPAPPTSVSAPVPAAATHG